LAMSVAVLVKFGGTIPFGTFLGVVYASILLVVLWYGAIRQHQSLSTIFLGEARPVPGSNLNKVLNSCAVWIYAGLYCVCMALGVLLIAILSVLQSH